MKLRAGLPSYPQSQVCKEGQACPQAELKVTLYFAYPQTEHPALQAQSGSFSGIPPGCLAGVSKGKLRCGKIQIDHELTLRTAVLARTRSRLRSRLPFITVSMPSLRISPVTARTCPDGNENSFAESTFSGPTTYGSTFCISVRTNNGLQRCAVTHCL